MPISSLSCLQAYLSDPYDVAAMIEICKTTMKLTESPSWQQALGKQFVHPSTRYALLDTAWLRPALPHCQND